MLSCHESGGEKIVIKFQYILLNTSSFLQNTFTHRPYSIEISAPATESTENSPVFHTKMLSTRTDSHRTQTAFWALKSIYKIPAPYFVSFILNMPLIQYGPMYWTLSVHVRINLKLADAKAFGNSWDYYKIKLRIMFLWIGMQNQRPQ